MGKKNEKLSIEYVRNFLKEINSPSELLSTEYINNHSPLIFKCNCGKIFKKRFDMIGMRKTCLCNSCGRKQGWNKIRKPIDYSDRIIKEFSELGFKVLQEKVSTIEEKVLVENKDGYRGYISIESARNKKMFSIYSVRFNKDNFIFNLNHYCELKHVGTRVLDYINDNEDNIKTWKIKLKCQCGCGNIFYPNANDFSSQFRVYCNICTKSQSRLERIVKTELELNNINFIEQKRFDNCRSDLTNYTLPFDFYLPKYNTLIEVDGEGHFRPLRFHGVTKEESIESFHRTLYHDNLKNLFCENNNINLVRISYLQIKDETYKKSIQSIINK